MRDACSGGSSRRLRDQVSRSDDDVEAWSDRIGAVADEDDGRGPHRTAMLRDRVFTRTLVPPQSADNVIPAMDDSRLERVAPGAREFLSAGLASLDHACTHASSLRPDELLR